MLTCIDVKFNFDSVHLGLSSSANILQITDVPLQVVFLLFLPCFWLLFCLVPAVVLTLETSEMSAIFFTTKATQPHTSALTCSGLHFWRHFQVNYVCAFRRSELGKYFEWIIIKFNAYGKCFMQCRVFSVYISAAANSLCQWIKIAGFTL